MINLRLLTLLLFPIDSRQNRVNAIHLVKRYMPLLRIGDNEYDEKSARKFAAQYKAGKFDKRKQKKRKSKNENPV